VSNWKRAKKKKVAIRTTGIFSFPVVCFDKYRGDEVKEDEMGGACNSYGVDEKCKQ
jgi:hypothetical protein